MPQPRKRQVSLQDTRYYHCISRCVRRAFLCGKDALTGYDFEHRRGWITARIKLVCSVFAIDLCAYAVMSNHYHVVVRINPDDVQVWSNHEVAERWLRIFNGPTLVRHYLAGVALSCAEQERVSEYLDTWRERLCSISWFMRCINEPIARMANAEDHCTGRFWEGRFVSQALLDERALLACMTYVDLNPIRAAMAGIPEQSEHTSIRERVVEKDNSPLLGFADQVDDGLPFSFTDYLELVDWAGRVVRGGKRSRIPATEPPILKRLGMTSGPLTDYLTKAERQQHGALGPVAKLQAFARSVGRKFVKGQSFARLLCPERA
jgi:putative transposase